MADAFTANLAVTMETVTVRRGTAPTSTLGPLTDADAVQGFANCSPMRWLPVP
ncbi:hypothetical protein [Arthrobacter zhaoguopingii]|uniref:hypothetical protein n=1 Tax=Arthrobacter zhaoguopingii TaxID=2681491 RepID=UPI003CCDC538